MFCPIVKRAPGSDSAAIKLGSIRTSLRPRALCAPLERRPPICPVISERDCSAATLISSPRKLFPHPARKQQRHQIGFGQLGVGRRSQRCGERDRAAAGDLQLDVIPSPCLRARHDIDSWLNPRLASEIDGAAVHQIAVLREEEPAAFLKRYSPGEAWPVVGAQQAKVGVCFQFGHIVVDKDRTAVGDPNVVANPRQKRVGFGDERCRVSRAQIVEEKLVDLDRIRVGSLGDLHSPADDDQVVSRLYSEVSVQESVQPFRIVEKDIFGGDGDGGVLNMLKPE
jgi:hypothetical protein